MEQSIQINNKNIQFDEPSIDSDTKITVYEKIFFVVFMFFLFFVLMFAGYIGTYLFLKTYF